MTCVPRPDLVYRCPLAKLRILLTLSSTTRGSRNTKLVCSAAVASSASSLAELLSR
jgi:hypothetical protein